MNRFDRIFGGREARLRYGPGEFKVLTQGDFVRCAVTGEIMRLAERRACGELPPRRRTYFGDGAWDQQACHSLGWEFIAIGGRLDHVPAFSSFLNAAAIRRCLGY